MASSGGFKCWTAPGEVFATREELHEHYKSEWHQYNLKRKVANLPAVPKAMFDKLQLIAAEREAARNAVVKGTDHLKQSKRLEGEFMATSQTAQAEPPGPPKDEVKADAVEEDEPDALPSDGPENAEQEKEYEVDEEELKKPVNPLVSFMDGRKFPTFNDTLNHLFKNYGFCIPDAEYCVDLNGLFKYCTQKVRAGRMCLWCDRPFRTKEGCVQHMISKSHCKIPWETDEHFEEYEDFFDYTDLNEEDANKPQNELRVMDTGEILLINRETGKEKILGHRDLKVAYNQKVQLEDMRPSVVAARTERMLLLYKRAGVDSETALTLANTQQMGSALALARPMWAPGRPEWMTKQLARAQVADTYVQHKMNLRDGLQINWQTKNKLRMTKSRQAGMGVHG